MERIADATPVGGWRSVISEIPLAVYSDSTACGWYNPGQTVSFGGEQKGGVAFR